MISKFQLPASPASGPNARVSREVEPTLFGRRVSVLLALVSLLPLPFVSVTSCGGGPPVATSGFTLFADDGLLFFVGLALVVALLGAARLGPRLARLGHRVALGAVELLMVAALWLDGLLAVALAGVVDKVELLPTSYVAMVLLAGLSLDVTATLGARAWTFAQIIRRARSQARQASTAGSSGEIT